MKLINNYYLSWNRKQELWTNIRGYDEVITKEDEKQLLFDLKRIFSSKRFSEKEKETAFYEAKQKLVSDPEAQAKILEETKKLQLDATTACENLIYFFKDFDFSPNFRFVNTFGRLCYYEDAKAAKKYVINYFKLTDNPYVKDIEDKLNSVEFNDIVNVLSKIEPRKTINKRFALYYGAQGTGKTTQAMKEADNNVMVCHSAMLPSDLMEDFKFENGQPNFTPSALQKAMTEGKPIVLDEINLLPFESLRFLQSILDGKEEFSYKGQTIKIADGFIIYGTMNLQVNGMTYALPEPLVDRAKVLKEFALTSDMLIGALL